MIDKNEIRYILQTDNLTVVRNGKTLLDRVNLRIERGSLIMLLGHNGAGKSVLLRTLHGLLARTDGDIKGPPAKRQKIVFQKPILLREARNISVLSVPAVPTKTLKPGLSMPV